MSSEGWKFQSKASRVLCSRRPLVAMRRAMRPSSLLADLGAEDVLEQGGGPGLLAGGPGEQLVEVAEGVGQAEEDEVSSESLEGEVVVGGRVASAAGSFGHGVSLLSSARAAPEGSGAPGRRSYSVRSRGSVRVLSERVGDAARGLLGDVLVERAGRGAGGEDALDGVVVEGAEARGVARARRRGRRWRSARAAGGSGAPGGPRRRGGPALMRRKKRAACSPMLLEGDAELVEVDGALPAGPRVEPGGVEPEPLAAGRELVARDAGEVGGVDEELALGDADRQDVGDVVVGDGVGVALPGDEAVDGAEAVDDARGVVGVARQGHEVLALAGEAVERRSRHGGGAGRRWCRASRASWALMSSKSTEGAAVEKGPLGLPEAPLDAGLGVGLAAHGARAKLVVGGEGEEAWIVDGLLPFPPQHDGLLAVVGARRGAAPEAREGLVVPVHERVEVRVPVEVEELAPGVDEHVGEGLHHLLVAVGEA